MTISQIVRNNTKLATVVPITTNTPGNPPPRVVAAQMRLVLNAGDTLLFTSTVETRAEMDYATLSAGFLRYTLDGQFINPGNPLDDAGIIARPMGENVWSKPHYHVDPRSAFFTATTSGVYVFQHVLYGASSAFTGDPNEKLDIIYVEQYALVITSDEDRIESLEARIDDLEAHISSLGA